MNKIIGVGLGRTGTSTLGTACEILGYKLKENDIRLTRAFREGNIKPALEVAENYDCLEDFPWLLIYKELDEYFPDSKFILTVRKDSTTWIRSYIYQFIRAQPNHRRPMINVALTEFGYPYPVRYEKEWIKIYEEHNQDVRNYFDGRDNFLELCWENGDGWKGLCEFLDKDIPDEIFPHRKNAYPYPCYDRMYIIARLFPEEYFRMK